MNSLPPTLLIVGTDLAGKDHCANVLADAIPGLPDAPDGTRVERVDVIIRLKRA